jgi:hypothetical protein
VTASGLSFAADRLWERLVAQALEALKAGDPKVFQLPEDMTAQMTEKDAVTARMTILGEAFERWLKAEFPRPGP